MAGGYQEVQAGFHRRQSGSDALPLPPALHMDFGFMTLFDYV